MLSPINLGNLTINVPLMLAPMAGMSDLPFREIARSLGAGYAVAEMTSSKPELWNTKKSQTRWSDKRESGLRVVQLLGADPEMMAKAAQYAQSQGAQVIDINMGCPAKKVVGRECGSSLLKDEGLVREIVTATKEATNLPTTLKIRTGWDREHKNALKIACIAQDCGISLLTIHGRTRADLFNGFAEYDTIAQVKREVTIPVIANGDIDSGEKAIAVLEKTNADGLMVGRASYGNPWIFTEILCALEGKKFVPPTLKEFENVLERHMFLHFNYYSEQEAIKKFRKHLINYMRHYAKHELTKEFFAPIFRAKTGNEFALLVKISTQQL